MFAARGSVDKGRDVRVGNQILANIPRDEYEDLLPDLKPAHLARGTVLYEAGSIIHDCFFPTRGMVSLLGTTEEGGAVEVGIVGNEGLVGVHVVLHARTIPYQVMTHVPAEGFTIKPRALQERTNRCGMLNTLLLRYVHARLCQISQSVICNRFHVVGQRLCRWLLVSSDRAQSDTFHLTQEALSYMLGVPRTNVTMTLGALQRKGLIRYKRGEISIVNRHEMELAVCECYRVVRDEINQFFD